MENTCCSFADQLTKFCCLIAYKRGFVIHTVCIPITHLPLKVTIKMVRRRTRGNATSKATANGILENGSAVALTNAQLLENQYFASPKRKDCKVEENSNNLNKDGVIKETSEREEGVVKGKTKSPSPNKMKGERGALNGKTIGMSNNILYLIQRHTHTLRM